jgi:hypothetical protein
MAAVSPAQPLPIMTTLYIQTLPGYIGFATLPRRYNETGIVSFPRRDSQIGQAFPPKRD